MKVQTFEWHFPIIRSVVNRGPVVVGVALLFSLGAAIIGDYVLSLGIISMGLGVYGLWIDRDCLNRWPIPPLFWFSSVCLLTGGIGPALFGSGDGTETAGLIKMQEALILGHFIFFSAYAVVRPRLTRVMDFKDLLARNLRMRDALIGAGVLCLLWAVADSVTGAISGVTDRGMAGEKAAYEVYGYWSYFLAFNRLDAIGFLLLPLIFAYTNIVCRSFVLIAAAGIIFMGFLSGSRASAFMPIVMMAIGYVGFIFQPRFRMELLAFVCLPFAAFAFVFLDYYRNTDIYRTESMADPIRKLQAVREARERSDEFSGRGSSILAERLIGVIDPIIYDTTPSVIPYSGFENYEAIAWLYVPSFFYSQRPIMLDGTALGERYKNEAMFRTSIGPSLVGDWYRRFGWGGVTIGMALSGVLFGYYVRLIVTGLQSHYEWAIGAWLLATGYIARDANMTVLTGLWCLLYDIPKHVLLLMLFFFIGHLSSSALTRVGLIRR